MSEQATVPVPAGREAGSPPTGAGADAAQRGRVRTDGETTVDEAMGAGDDVH